MADVKIPSMAKKARHPVDEFLLRFLVEIDHHVPAENEIESPGEGIMVLEVQAMKSYEPFDMRSYLVFRSLVLAGYFVKIGVPE